MKEFEGFGKEIFEKAGEHLINDNSEMEIDEIMFIAEKFNLVKNVKYDERLHGLMDVDSGDNIWWWGD